MMSFIKEISFEHTFVAALFIVLLQTILFGVVVSFPGDSSAKKSTFLLFFKIFAVCFLSTCIPFGWLSMLFGLPAVFTASLILTIMFKGEF